MLRGFDDAAAVGDFVAESDQWFGHEVFLPSVLVTCFPDFGNSPLRMAVQKRCAPYTCFVHKVLQGDFLLFGEKCRIPNASGGHDARNELFAYR
jgi:hypothetical protein